jgi:predicted Zn-dependent protease
MEYENRQPDEGINVSKTNHVTDFFVLLIGAFVVLMIFTALVAFGAGWLAKKIPFDYERSLVSSFEHLIEPNPNGQLEQYLQKLSQNIQACSELPDDMTVQVHYIDRYDFNAYATLGGHVFLFKGLLKRLDSENQLAMILGHEMGHIKHRDPIVGLGRGTVVSVALSLVLGHSPQVLGDAGLMTLLSFSRGMETDSDVNGVQVLQRCYGHANGSYQVFELFKQYRIESEAGESMLPFFQTHPLDDDRINDIRSYAAEQSIPLTGELTPLPPDFHHWLGQ